MLVRLMYASRSSDAFDAADGLQSILKKAKQHNTVLGVTGALCFSAGTFLQVLEGGRVVVSQLYNRIAKDVRHHDVVLLSFEEIPERRFAHWAMGHVNMARLNPVLLLKYSANTRLDPYAVPAAVSAALFDELVATASVMGQG